MNKLALLDTVIADLRAMADRAEDARRKAQQEANSHLGRLESRYDTFKEEAQYLEAGQQHRAAEIAGWIRSLDELRTSHPELLQPCRTVRVGAIVSVELPDEPRPQHYFVLPVGVGAGIAAGDRIIQPLSWGAPLARRIAGRQAGERVRVGAGTPPRIARVLDVA